jgi:hypothetical protein
VGVRCWSWELGDERVFAMDNDAWGMQALSDLGNVYSYTENVA